MCVCVCVPTFPDEHHAITDFTLLLMLLPIHTCLLHAFLLLTLLFEQTVYTWMKLIPPSSSWYMDLQKPLNPNTDCDSFKISTDIAYLHACLYRFPEHHQATLLGQCECVVTS